MGLRDRLEGGAQRLEKTARSAASSNLSKQVASSARAAGRAAGTTDTGKRAAGGFTELKAIVTNDNDAPLSAELFLVSLVRAVRLDDGFEGRSVRDVYEEARNRRRLLGIASFGAGPLRGVATQLSDLYCEIAIMGDLANTHHLPLDDDHVAAHMLALWEIAGDATTGLALIRGTADRSLTAVLADPLRTKAAGYVPPQMTRRALTTALWQARGAIGDVRSGATGKGTVRGVVFAGKRAKALIARASAQLEIEPGDALTLEPGADEGGSWQPDPTDRHEHRYHDGRRWTYHVSDAGQTSLDGKGLSELA